MLRQSRAFAIDSIDTFILNTVYIIEDRSIRDNAMTVVFKLIYDSIDSIDTFILSTVYIIEDRSIRDNAMTVLFKVIYDSLSLGK